MSKTWEYRLFKGTKSQYTILHAWVRKNLGTPNLCSECETSDKTRVFHWANVSGKYKKDLKDWRRMCAQCHMRYDRKNFGSRRGIWREFCPNGHKMLINNLYLRRASKTRPYRGVFCKACRYEEQSKVLIRKGRPRPIPYSKVKPWEINLTKRPTLELGAE